MDKLVPIEPTEAMMKAGAEVAAPAFLEWNTHQRHSYMTHVRAIYQAMLEKSPHVPRMPSTATKIK